MALVSQRKRLGVSSLHSLLMYIADWPKVTRFLWKKALIGQEMAMGCVPYALIGWLTPTNPEPVCF